MTDSATRRLTDHDLVTLGAAALAVVLAAIGAAAPGPALLVAAGIAAFVVFLRADARVSLAVLGFLFPFEGLRIAIPPFGDPTLAAFFPNGIHLPLGYAVTLLMLSAVGVRILVAVLNRAPIRIHLPLVGAAALFWASGLLSVPSVEEGKVLAVKYVLYPIAFSFVGYVLLPAQLARTREAVLALARGMVAAGAVATAMGAISLFIPQAGVLRTAMPLPILGVWPLGENHNLLAETLVATAPLALAFALRSRGRRRRLLLGLAVSMAAVALLTFARTAWIAFAVMAAAAVAVEWRREAARHALAVVGVAALTLPLLAALFFYSGSRQVEGSTASRVALTQFAVYLFGTHPVVGAGAGTFVQRLGEDRDFLQDFGDPLDAHGFGQKILAEQGTVGIAAFLFLLARVLLSLLQGVRLLPAGSADRRTLFLLAVPALGTMVYEVFNTTYYAPKLWLPIGLALAALPAWTGREARLL